MPLKYGLTKIRYVLPSEALACYVGLCRVVSTAARVDDGVDKTHIYCHVFREHGIKITQKFNELIGGLGKASESGRKVREMTQTSTKLCAYRSVLVYENPVPAG
jgi:hypothetical protein